MLILIFSQSWVMKVILLQLQLLDFIDFNLSLMEVNDPVKDKGSLLKSWKFSAGHVHLFMSGRIWHRPVRFHWVKSMANHRALARHQC